MSNQLVPKSENCLNCGAKLQGDYCHECGQKNKDIQLSFFKLLKNFFDEITFFDNKIFTTLKLLIYNPAKLTQSYINGKRMRFVPPFRLYLFLSSIYFIFAVSNMKEGISKIKLNENPELAEVMQDSILQKELELNLALKEKDSLEISKSDWIEKKWKSLTAEFEKDPQLFISEFTTTFSEKLPYLLYLSLPALAFLLWLFYWRKTRSYYVNHFVFSLYLFSSVFFYLILENVIEIIINQFTTTPFNFNDFNFILFGIFPYIALYLFYKQSLIKTFFKLLLLSLVLSIYMFTLLLVMLVASVISL